MTSITISTHELLRADPGWRVQVIKWRTYEFDPATDGRESEAVTVEEFVAPVAYWARDRASARVVPVSFKLGPAYEAVLAPAWEAGLTSTTGSVQVESVVRAPGDPDLDMYELMQLPKGQKRLNVTTADRLEESDPWA